MAERQQISRRRALVAAVAACSLAAAAATAVRAANDPRGLAAGEDDAGRAGASLHAVEPVVAAGQMSAAPLRGNPLWAVQLDALRATRERPLFTPSRRPPAPPVAAAAPVEPVRAPPPPVEPDRPPLDLLGLAIGTVEAVAVFINPATHDIVRLKTGEGHDGWVLQSVKGREAVLEKNNRSAVIALPLPVGDKK